MIAWVARGVRALLAGLAVIFAVAARNNSGDVQFLLAAYWVIVALYWAVGVVADAARWIANQTDRRFEQRNEECLAKWRGMQENGGNSDD